MRPRSRHGRNNFNIQYFIHVAALTVSQSAWLHHQQAVVADQGPSGLANVDSA
jgi:hypothetical protein